MHFSYLLDGAEIEMSAYKDFEARKLLSWADVTPLKDGSHVRINCVGFSINQEEETLTVFPKHFETGSSPSLDTFAPVFRAVQMAHQSNSLAGRWGKEASTLYPAAIDTNYPFGAFFQILAYYHQYGLHFDQVCVNSRDKGKINWKKTISNASFYLANNKIVMFPLRRESILRTSHFITDAMIFAINHTRELFSPLLNIQTLPYQTSIQSDIQDYPFIARRLRQIRSQTFNDRLLILVDSLIDFFTQTNHGHGYYFKIRNFSFLWQLAVAKYMGDKFEKLDDFDVPIFRENGSDENRFTNLLIRDFNSARPDQTINIDHYWADEVSKIQYVFDAKYYNKVPDLNYKQIFYTLIQSLDFNKQGFSTVSALILPAKEFECKTHFSLNKLFSNQMEIQNPTLKIMELYLDCRLVLHYFQSTSLY